MQGPPSSLTWEVRLGNLHAERRWIVVALGLVTVPIGWGLLGSPIWGLLGLAVILGATADLFLPIRYVVGPKGVISKCGFVVSEIDWGSVKSLRHQPSGVVVSPLEGESRLQAFRGVFLRYANNEAEVLAKIGEFWRQDEGVLGEGTDGGGDRRDGL